MKDAIETGRIIRNLFFEIREWDLRAHAQMAHGPYEPLGLTVADLQNYHATTEDAIAYLCGQVAELNRLTQWTPADEEDPENEGDYLVTLESGLVIEGSWQKRFGWLHSDMTHPDSEVVAWMPKPTPYPTKTCLPWKIRLHSVGLRLRTIHRLFFTQCINK